MRVFNRFARQQPTKQQACGLIFAEIFVQKDMHLLRPVRDIWGSGVLREGLRVLKCKR